MNVKISFLLLILSSSLFAGVGFKGIHNIKVDPEKHCAYFSIDYTGWVDEDIGIMDVRTRKFKPGITLDTFFPGYRLLDFHLIPDTKMVILLTNKNNWKPEEEYRSVIIIYNIVTRKIEQQREYNNQVTAASTVDAKNIYLLFDDGTLKSLAIDSLELVYEQTIAIRLFPRMVSNNQVLAVFDDMTGNFKVHFLECSSGTLINTIKTDKVEDIYLGTDLYYILTYNKLGVYSKDLELVDTHDFREYGISPVIDLVQDRFVVLDWTWNGESNHYLYSIAAGKMKKIDTIPGLYISTIKPLKGDVYMIGYSEITGVFNVPSLKPGDLIEIRELSFK